MHGRSLPHRLPRWVRLGGGFGAFLEVILALANVGTAVSLYPVVKRQNEGVALGYVGLRTLESGIIAVGIVSLLAVVTLWQHLAGDLRLGDRRAVRLYTRVSAWGAVTAVPVFAWEISLALYLIVKGFRPSAAAGLHASPVVAGAQPVAA